MTVKLTEEQVAELIEAYRLGYGVTEIARCLGVSHSSVRSRLRTRGELRPKHKMTEEELRGKGAARSKRYYFANKEKCVAYRKAYYEAHKRDPGGQLERSKAKYKANPAILRLSNLAKYKLSIAEWNEMLIRQSGRCAICLFPMRSPHIDHDHTTGKVRGLLCSHCNRGLGAFYDSADSLLRAADYVKEHLEGYAESRVA